MKDSQKRCLSFIKCKFFLVPCFLALLVIMPQKVVAAFSGCPVFPHDNVWNTPVDDLLVDVRSSAYINAIGADIGLHPDFGSGLWQGAPIGIPVNIVHGNQPLVPITFDYADESDPGPYPIPPNPLIEGGSQSTGDRHILVLDRDHCLLYETWSAYPQGDGSWHAGSGAVFDLRSNALRPQGWTSADAAGLPILPGLIRYDEVATGEITHAIRFTAPHTRKAFVWPARHYASNLEDTTYPPMGQRFRLKADFDISGFSRDVQIILRALKKYGLILADNGCAWYLSGTPDSRWDNDTLVNELRQVKGSNFEAVDETGLMVDPGSGQVSSTTGQFNADPPDAPVKLIFIHHSCGENWLADDNGGLGIDLQDNNYFVSDTNYDWGPDNIGDYTDIGQWWTWFRGENSATYTNAVYNESSQHSSYSRLPHDPGGENKIIMFKSCFPNSNLGGSPQDPPASGPNPLRGQDCASPFHTVANAKGIYNDLLQYFASQRDKLFIAVTAPPLCAFDTGTEAAANARALNNWLVTEWLKDYPYNNVAVFDFYNVLTSNGENPHSNDAGSEIGNHHRFWNNDIQHLQTVNNDTAAYPSGPMDSHPTQAGNQKASAEFVHLLNVYYHCWQGTGACPGDNSSPVSSTTYYVRPDGGTAEQCTGLVDAPYPGQGLNQPCAWSHPFWALDNNNPPGWKIHGGDTIVIAPGSYRMGLGAPHSEWCDSNYPWDCHLPALPSGADPGHPTRVVGKGWDTGCSSPPELWGTERAWPLIDLENTSNAVLACLELTDHSGCVEFHADPAARCQRDSYPYGDWAPMGIYAVDSAHVLLQDLNIHGLANTGIRAGRISDWTLDRVRLAGNGWAGWDGDLGPDQNSSNSGQLHFKHWTVEWNGCAETYPGQQPADCWAQPAGGYGDGVGTATTGGHWIIEDSLFRYNTSDGLDLLYVREPGSEIEIRRTQAYGNAGNQIKVTGSVRLENVLAVGDCSFFAGKSFAPDIGGNDPIDHCRAGGAALSFSVLQGDQVSLVNATVAGEGDCLATFECDWENSSCDGTEGITVINSIFLGYPDYTQPGDRACYFWFDQDDFYEVQWDYNIIFDSKIGDNLPPLGANDLLQDPLLADEQLDSFDGHLTPASPAIDSGLAVGSMGGLVPDHDLENTSRPQGAGVDRGAYETIVGSVEIGVNITPQQAVDNGARWRIDNNAWRASGETMNLELGRYALTFQEVDGWLKPLDKTVTVVDSDTVIVEDAETSHTYEGTLVMIPGAYLKAEETDKEDPDDSTTIIDVLPDHFMQFLKDMQLRK